MAALEWLPATEGAGAALLLVNVGEWSFIFRDVILRLRGSLRCVGFDFPDLGSSEA